MGGCEQGVDERAAENMNRRTVALQPMSFLCASALSAIMTMAV
jgi:hypothetical protein